MDRLEPRQTFDCHRVFSQCPLYRKFAQGLQTPQATPQPSDLTDRCGDMDTASPHPWSIQLASRPSDNNTIPCVAYDDEIPCPPSRVDSEEPCDAAPSDTRTRDG